MKTTTIQIELSCVLNENVQTHYLIYKITNKINNRYYIGQHITNNPYDSYAGSGMLINKAEKKHGISAFVKTILYDFMTFEEMNTKENELVQLSNCYPYDPMSYNLKEGGYQGRLSEESQALCHQHCHETCINRTPEEKEALHKKMSELTSGEKNPMYGHKWTDEQKKQLSKSMKGKNSYANLTSKEYIERCEKIRQSKIGDKNPMYGKNAEDFMTEEAIMHKREKIRQHQLGTKRMINPNDLNTKVINVKLDEVDEYLKMGYVFFTCYFVLKNHEVSRYAKYHNMFFIEISKCLEEYFKSYNGQIVPNDMAYSILRHNKSEFKLHQDGIHYYRQVRSNSSIQSEMLILMFKDKQDVKDAIFNKNKSFSIDNLFPKDFQHQSSCMRIKTIISFIQKLNELYENGCNEILDNWKRLLNKSIGILTYEQKKEQLSFNTIIQIQKYLALARNIRSNMKYIRIRKFKIRYQSHATSEFLMKS